MSWTYQYLMEDRPHATSTYGMICSRDRKYYIVLLSSLGLVLFRTEKFPREEALQPVLAALRKCCLDDSCYEIKTIDNAFYFTITAPSGYTLAIGDQCCDLKTVQRKIRLVKELGANVGLVHLPKVQRRQNQGDLKRDQRRERKKQLTKKRIKKI